MRGTMEALVWAFRLQNIEPDSKLLAIYIAGAINLDGVAIIDITEAAEWCGFVSTARREPQISRLMGSLQYIPGIRIGPTDGDQIAIYLTGASQ